ncbi:DUF309 domain-containing protein [Bacillus xiapuensis]|uniref:DUF309 domain-containing protein n=1 Tax=Bacillus xiapuensis TaxID=2014075 RepID=UPI0012FE5B9F|nr:DUF309 domain-containing protein [Bacillus xiapuensis]
MYSYPLPYLTFLYHFHEDQDYFECHEVLEEYWKESTGQARPSVWIGLIQTAVSLYHHRRGNFAGARKLMNKALLALAQCKKELKDLGIDADRFTEKLSLRYRELQNGASFTPLTIPFSRQDVIKQYQQFKKSCMPSSPEKPQHFLYHKHRLRNRSDVIAARNQSLEKRRRLRQHAKPSPY